MAQRSVLVLFAALLLCLVHTSMGGVIPAREPSSVTDDDGTTSGHDYKLAWEAKIGHPLTDDDDDLHRLTRNVQHGDDPTNMMKAAPDSIKAATEAREESEMVKQSDLMYEEMKIGSKITAQSSSQSAESLQSGKFNAAPSKMNSLKVGATPSMANTKEATALKKASVQGKRKMTDDEMSKTIIMKMSHKLNSYIGETLLKDLAMEKSYNGIPEAATNLETLVHEAEMADMRAALEDMKGTMAAIAKKMFPARHAEAKGPVQPARISPPRSHSPLDGAAHLASASNMDSELTLDSSAALLRDGESTSNAKPRRGLVADDELVFLKEEGDSIAKTSSIKKTVAKSGDDDSTLAKHLPNTYDSPIVVKLFEDAKMESTDVPTEIIESTETPAVDTLFTETPAEGTAYTEAPAEGTEYTEAPAEAESTVPSVDTGDTEAPEAATDSTLEEVTTHLPIDSTTVNIEGLEPPEVENAPPIIIIVDGDKDPVAVSNIHPKKKPKFSDSRLPALVQILTHLIEELDLKEISMSRPVTEAPSVTETPVVEVKPDYAVVPAPVTGTPPSVIPVVATSPNTGSDGGSGITIVQLTIPNLTLGDKPSESLVIEVIPVAKNGTQVADKKKVKASDVNDDVEDMQEDMPVVQHDVPIVNEETVPMTMVINMVPSDEHEMMVDDDPESEALFFRNVEEMEESDDVPRKEEIAAQPTPAIRAPSPSVTRPTRQDAAATKEVPLTDMAHTEDKHRYVYYPTLFFADTWQRSPGNASGYLGFNEGPSAMKDHVDLEEETALKDSADDDLDEHRSEFDDLKDNGFLLTEIREAETNVTERPPPSPELKTLVKLRFHLSTDAKKQGLAKYQGFSDALIKELAETNQLTGREQFVVVLKKVLANGEITSARTIDRAEEVLEEVEDANSALSKSLDDIPALQYLATLVLRNS